MKLPLINEGYTPQLPPYQIAEVKYLLKYVRYLNGKRLYQSHIASIYQTNSGRISEINTGQRGLGIVPIRPTWLDQFDTAA